jgi:serine protease DegQ
VSTINVPASTDGVSVSGEIDTNASFARIPLIVGDVEPSIVAIFSSVPSGTLEGSGVIWSSNGLIVTNHHVIAGATAIVVQFATGQSVSASVVGSDQLTDLAVIKVNGSGLPVAKFAMSLPREGDLVIALGNPLGLEQSATHGIVAGLARTLSEGSSGPTLLDLIQMDAPIAPGNSGGALVNASGAVVGINVATLALTKTASSIGFAIPSITVRSVVAALIAHTPVNHPYLGVRPDEITPQLTRDYGLPQNGALVIGVDPGSPAAGAGIRSGDIITSFAGKTITSVDDFYTVLRNYTAGDKVKIGFLRSGVSHSVQVVLTLPPP